MGFRENLKGELEYKGMPVKELAHKTGIPKQTIDKYLLSNSRMPSVDNAVSIAQALDVTVEYLVTGKKNPVDKALVKQFSPETRSIIECIEPLSAENRKIIKTAVTELALLLSVPPKDEQVTFTPLQKVFIRLFR